MKSLAICIFGSLGLWAATDTVSVAFQIIIGVITVVAILYEKKFFKTNCINCRFYHHYVNHQEGRKDDKGIEKQ